MRGEFTETRGMMCEVFTNVLSNWCWEMEKVFNPTAGVHPLIPLQKERLSLESDLLGERLKFIVFNIGEKCL